MNATKSSASHRKILVCVCGTSPAVITETLYALVMHHAFVPNEIHVITTLTGRNEISQKLWNGPRFFQQFMSIYLPDQCIRFDEQTVHVIGDEATPLQDIKSNEDNRKAGDKIYAVMRRLKTVPGTQLHASIAGGRKSMSFYMGHAFSLVAEEQDKLSHVLVSDPFERVPDFYFPPLIPRDYSYPDKTGLQTIPSSQAHISLAEVSVLKLGSMIQSNIPKKAETDFDFAVQVAQACYEAPKVSISKQGDDLTVKVMGQTVKLEPRHLLVFVMFAYARSINEDPEAVVLDIRLFDAMESHGIHSISGVYFAASSGQESGAPQIKSVNSDIKTAFQSKIGAAARWFSIQKHIKHKTDFTYSFKLPRHAIELTLSEIDKRDLQKALDLQTKL